MLGVAQSRRMCWGMCYCVQSFSVLAATPALNQLVHPPPALHAGEEPWRSLPHFGYTVHDELDDSAAAVARIRAAQKASRIGRAAACLC